MTDPASTFVATCDLAGHTRGRGVPQSAHDRVLTTGVGWVPADLAVSAFGSIAPENAFGSRGDLRLMPDPQRAVELPASADRPGVRLYLADQVHPDGRPWHCCPRTFLRDALEALRRHTGLEVAASLEHEFVLDPVHARPPFSFQRYREAEPFGSELLGLLEHNGLQPETWLPEYGDGQYEVTLRPAEALAAADRAVALRELVRDLARQREMSASFAPLLNRDGAGNGVHIHLSLRDVHGRPALFDPSRPGRLSTVGSKFCAGILRHAPALTAWTAPSPASFLRLTPHRWSVGGCYLAERDREALLRLCPTTEVDGGDPAEAFHVEYRAADATANPWLTLGVLVCAGLRGLAEDYADPTVWPAESTDAEVAGVAALPRSLDQALHALEVDEAARTWFAPDLLATQLAVKRCEIAEMEGLDDATRIRKVADVY